MSHYTVMVFGKNFVEQLAPYDESILVPPYPSYVDERMVEYHTGKYLEANPGAVPTPSDLAKYLNERRQDEDDDEKYGVDETGLFYWTTYNPNSKWDWYEVGGRWAGYFILKEGAKGERGEDGLMGSNAGNDADIVRRGDVDAEAMRRARGEAAGERWDTVSALTTGLPEAESWPAMRERFPEKIDDARDAYAAQERVKALQKHDQEHRARGDHGSVILGLDGDVAEFQVPREEFVQKARDSAIPPFAYLVDGHWHGPGRMGWWGMSTDGDEERAQFDREFNEMFDALPDDTLITLVDLHI